MFGKKLCYVSASNDMQKKLQIFRQNLKTTRPTVEDFQNLKKTQQ